MGERSTQGRAAVLSAYARQQRTAVGVRVVVLRRRCAGAVALERQESAIAVVRDPSFRVGRRIQGSGGARVPFRRGEPSCVIVGKAVGVARRTLQRHHLGEAAGISCRRSPSRAVIAERFGEERRRGTLLRRTGQQLASDTIYDRHRIIYL